MLLNLKRIIRLVFEFYRDTWKVFLSLSGAFGLIFATTIVGLQNKPFMPMIVIPIAALTLICFVVGVILWVKCYKDVRKKDYEQKHPKPKPPTGYAF